MLIYFAFRSVCTTSDLRSKVLTFGKLQINLHFLSLIRTFAGAKQCSGLPLVVTREESPGSAGHPTCESTSSRRRLDMGEENDRQWCYSVGKGEKVV